MCRVFIGLGSNLGDRREFLQRAVDALGRIPETTVVACSSVYRTEPVGFKEQPEYFNAVAELDSRLSASVLHAELKSIERAIGRTPSQHWGPREIDLDLLYYGDHIVLEDGLRVPHPEAANRRFVLVPLKEIAGAFVDPLRKLAVTEMLAQCTDASGVRTTDQKLLSQTKES